MARLSWQHSRPAEHPNRPNTDPTPSLEPAAIATAPHPSPVAGALLSLRQLTVPRSLRPLVAVIATYLLAMLVIPTMAPVAISDDWTYTRSVEYLIEEGRFHILSVAAATQVFQLFWGALFAGLFGMTFGALRLSTVVLVLLSGLAFYGLCRELRVSRERSALGTAVYLFNPVLFALAYTFMSDPHYLALMVIASYGYVRGLRPGLSGERATLLGATVAALACLQRPHGALIPLGVVTYLVLSRRLRFSRSAVVPFLRVVALPALTFVGYYLFVSRGLPDQQGYFLDEARAAGFAETWLLVRRLTVIETVYIGLFVFPLVAAAVPAFAALTRLDRSRQWLAVLSWEAILIGGLVWFAGEDRWMPYIPHFLGQAGPGSGDLREARPALAGHDAFVAVTIACGVASFLFALAVARSMGRQLGPDRSAAGMIVGLMAWQVVGAVPPSLLFRNWVISLDRYILPLMPFAILLVLWALNDVRLVLPLAWPLVALLALFSIAGTRDALVFQENVWMLARQLNNQGVQNTSLDAGYAWDAYHLWEFGVANGIPQKQFTGSWWTDVYAPATDSTYIIAGSPIPGYLVLREQPYSAWLQREPVLLYVLQREPPPPDAPVQ
jgi:4-amino-4-deoxy-L-arabinose transferase-like glycosyltransferase